jgi:hypothetical protein
MIARAIVSIDVASLELVQSPEPEIHFSQLGRRPLLEIMVVKMVL